jgi:hypothetical protein
LKYGDRNTFTGNGSHGHAKKTRVRPTQRRYFEELRWIGNKARRIARARRFKKVVP